MSPRETLLWTVVAAVTFVGLAAYFGEVDNNDGYQYVSIAENIRSTGHISTSLVHFDTEREHATIPAPETTFPPGYSAFISLVSILGPGPDFAAEIVSVLGAILVALFLCKLCLVIGCSVNAARFAVILWLANSYALAFSRTVASESLFAATITAAILLLLVSDQTLRRDEAVPRTLTWAFILAGLSAWIRYAGYFIFCGFLLYALVLLLMRVRRKIVVLQSLLAGGSLITALLVRNIVLTSTWKGGNTTPVSNSISETARNGVGALIKLVFGDYARADVRLPMIGLCAAIALSLLALVKTKGRLPLSRPVYLLFSLICVYSALMFYAGLHTPINFGSRMFLPILPLILAVLSWTFGRAVEFSPPGQRQIALLSILLFTASYLFANTRSELLLAPSADSATCPKTVQIGLTSRGGYCSPATMVRLQLAEPDDHGIPVSAWIESHLDSGTTILASEGQAAGYVLHRPTISLLEHRFSQVDWTEPNVQQTMTAFHAQYLLVFPRAGSLDAPAQYESPFISALVNRQYPDWLQIAESNPEVIVYQKIR